MQRDSVPHRHGRWRRLPGQPIGRLSVEQRVYVGALTGALVAYIELLIMTWLLVGVPWPVALMFSAMYAIPAGLIVGGVAGPTIAHFANPRSLVKHLVMLNAAGSFAGFAATFVVIPNKDYVAYLYAPTGAILGCMLSALAITAYQRLRPDPQL